jgi:MFS transporter, SP family, sugar:H+ symporter
MARFGFGNRHAADSTTSTAVPSPTNSVDIPAVGKDAEKGNGKKLVGLPSVGFTLRTVVMTILVAMGGFIFGYDTGQISGFLEMKVFLERFGQPTSVSETHPYGLYFTNVRSGLIVALVSSNALPLLASS